MDNQNRSLEFALLLTLPAAVALAVAAEPIIRVLFERGAFACGRHARDRMAPCRRSRLGLPSFVLIKVLQPAFFAREDTRTPMRYAVWNMVLNIAGSIALFFIFPRAGPHATRGHCGRDHAFGVGECCPALAGTRQARARDGR